MVGHGVWSKERGMAWRAVLFSDLGVLVLLAVGRILLQAFTNGQYGFHRDELAMVDDARNLAWGFVAYPPLTPFVGRVALELFGPSLMGLRLFSLIAQGTALVLVGLMARSLGGPRRAQILAALAVTTTPGVLVTGSLFQYVTFDYLWWVLLAYCTVRLLASEDPRWWLGIGAAIGLGAMTKYNIAFLVAGLAVGLLLTKNRRYLLSPWLWGGAALAALIVLPNLVWQIQHQWITLEFLSDIHARDVRIGRTDEFFLDQFVFLLNPLTIYLAVSGLIFYLFSQAGERFRMVGWMFLTPLALLIILRGRGYYLMAAYPMLIAAGAVVFERWLRSRSENRARAAYPAAVGLLVVGGFIFAALVLPVAPLDSGWWEVNNEINGEMREEVGWPELVASIAQIYSTLPAEERAVTGVLAGNYGEAGAVNLYGPAYDLPRAISGINSYWLRGYGDPPPQTLIVVGLPSSFLSENFDTCKLAGHVTNRYNIRNEETEDHPDLYICRGLRKPWPEFWKTFRYFG